MAWAALSRRDGKKCGNISIASYWPEHAASGAKTNNFDLHSSPIIACGQYGRVDLNCRAAIHSKVFCGVLAVY